MYTKVSIPGTAHVGSGGVSALLAVPTHAGDSSCKLSLAANSLGSSHPSFLETGHQEGNQGSGITLGVLRGCSGAPRVSHISHHQPARKGSGLPGEDRQAEREGQGLVLWPLVLLGFRVTLPLWGPQHRQPLPGSALSHHPWGRQLSLGGWGALWWQQRCTAPQAQGRQLYSPGDTCRVRSGVPDHAEAG